MNLPTISVCAIVKNEEKNVYEFLENISQFGDEIIVTDTGSTDQTLQKIRTFESQNKKVNIDIQQLNFEGQFHFGKAKNASLRRATKDYCVIFDADFRATSEFIENIKTFLADKKPTVARYKVTDEYVHSLIDFPIAIIKNRENILFKEDNEYLVHEELDFATENLPIF